MLGKCADEYSVRKRIRRDEETKKWGGSGGRGLWAEQSVGERVHEGMWVARGGGWGANQLTTSVCRTRVSLYTSHVSCCLTQ